MLSFTKHLGTLIHNTQVQAHVAEEMRPTPKYLLLLVLSTLLAHLGIMAGQATVTIGSMLISPLVWPVIGMSLGIVRNEPKMVFSGVINFLASVTFALGVSFLLTLLFDPQAIGMNAEITSRISPNLLDLGIALASGVAGAMIVSWEKVSDAAAGVAVASSVLLPITVTGIGLAIGNYDIAGGSFLLFLTSICSIVFTGIVVFLFLGHHKNDGIRNEGLLTLGLITSTVGLIVLAVPLSITLTQMLEENGVARAAEIQLQSSLTAYDESIFVDSVQAKNVQTASGTTMHITALVRSDDSLRIPYEEMLVITQGLEKSLDHPVKLDLRILPQVATITDDLQAREQRMRQQERMSSLISGIFKEIDPRISLDTLQLSNSDPVLVTVLVRAPTYVNITNNHRLHLLERLQTELRSGVKLDLNVLRTDTISDTTKSPESELLSSLEKAVDQLGIRLAPTGDVTIAKREASHTNGIYTLRVTLRIPERIENSQQFQIILQNTLRSSFSPLGDTLRIEVTEERFNEV